MAVFGLPWSRERDVLAAVRSLPDGFLKTYCLWASQQTEAPLIYHVGVGAALLAAVAPVHFRLQGHLPESGLRANLFVLLVGRQGIDRKSTAIKRGVGLLQEAVPDRRGDEPHSPQGFVDSLVERPQQILVYEDMADLYGMTQRRQGGNQLTGLKGKLLRAFDCDPVSYRLRKLTLREENPRLSILGGVNRPILDTYVDAEDWETGLTSRFYTAYGRVERTLHHRQPDPQIERWLMDWLGQAAQFAPEENLWGPLLGLEPDALHLLCAFEQAVQDTAPTGSRACGPRARVRTMALKLAMLIGFGAAQGWPSGPNAPGQAWMIDLPTMTTAINLALMGFGGALAITHTMSDSHDMQDRRRVLEAVRPSWTPTSEILRNAQVLHTRAEVILKTLLQENTIEQSPRGDYKSAVQGLYESGVTEAGVDLMAIWHAYEKYASASTPPGNRWNGLDFSYAGTGMGTGSGNGAGSGPGFAGEVVTPEGGVGVGVGHAQGGVGGVEGGWGSGTGPGPRSGGGGTDPFIVDLLNLPGA